MKIFSSNIGTQAININGEIVKFVNGIAEVSDEFGKEILDLGFPGMYELGKQPVYETPKEIQMKSDFAEKEAWYLGECNRLKAIADSYKDKVKELEADVAVWKAEYQKEVEARKALAATITGAGESTVEEEAPKTVIEPENEEKEGDTNDNPTEKELRAELEDLKKDALIQFALESGISEETIKGKTKAEIIEEIVKSIK